MTVTYLSDVMSLQASTIEVKIGLSLRQTSVCRRIIRADKRPVRAFRREFLFLSTGLSRYKASPPLASFWEGGILACVRGAPLIHEDDRNDELR